MHVVNVRTSAISWSPHSRLDACAVLDWCWVDVFGDLRCQRIGLVDLASISYCFMHLHNLCALSGTNRVEICSKFDSAAKTTGDSFVPVVSRSSVFRTDPNSNGINWLPDVCRTNCLNFHVWPSAWRFGRHAEQWMMKMILFSPVKFGKIVLGNLKLL